MPYLATYPNLSEKLFISLIFLPLIFGTIFFPVFGLLLYLILRRSIPRKLGSVFLLVIWCLILMWWTFSSPATSDVWRIAEQFRGNVSQILVDMKIYRAFLNLFALPENYNFYLYLIITYILTALSFKAAISNLEDFAKISSSRISFVLTLFLLMILLPLSYAAAPEYMLSVCMGFYAISSWNCNKKKYAYFLFVISILVHWSMVYLLFLHFIAAAFDRKRPLIIIMHLTLLTILAYFILMISNTGHFSELTNYMLYKIDSYFNGVWSQRYGLVENVNFYFILFKLLVMALWLKSTLGYKLKLKSPYLYYLAWSALIFGLFFSSYRTLAMRYSDYLMIIFFSLILINWDDRYRQKARKWITLIIILNIFRPHNALYLYGVLNSEKVVLEGIFSPLYYAITTDYMEPKDSISGLNYRGHRND